MTNDLNPSAPSRAEVEPVAAAVSRPLQSLRKHWLPALLIMGLGTGSGVALGVTRPVTYTAEARVAVGAGDLSTGAIAGFPLAAKELASNYARWINDQGLRNDQTEGVTMAASPIPESSIIRVEGTGTNLAAVTKATEATANELVKAANGDGTNLDPKVTFTAYTKASDEWAAAKSALTTAQAQLDKLLATPNGATTGTVGTTSQITTAREAVTKAMALETQKLQYMNALGAKYQNQLVNASQAADLVVVRKAEESSNDRMSQIQRYGLLGLIVGSALALLAAVALDRRERR